MQDLKNSKRIGFIGTGVMGASMARNLQKHGYELSIYTRTKAKAESLLAEGMQWQASPAALAKTVDIVITMVGYPQDVEQVYLGENGVLSTKVGGAVIDMTTSSPRLAKKIYEAAKAKGIAALDAPVSGGDVGAKTGRLAIMVGGDADAFQSLLPVFSAMGETIQRFGAAGSGQHAKMCNQIAIASNMMGVAECLAYADKAGLNANALLGVITKGAAGSWSLANLAPRMVAGDMKPGFYIKHFIKDMRIALEEAEAMNLDLPGLALAKKLYDQLANKGMENLGTQALLRYYLP